MNKDVEEIRTQADTCKGDKVRTWCTNNVRFHVKIKC
jgi:hypothetical protein